jgi:protein SCO1
MAEAHSAESLGQRIQNRVGRLTGTPWFWIVFLGVLFSFPIGRALVRKVPEPPQVIFPLPEFTLTDHLGNAFGTEQLRGKVWVANFIFTSCPTRCPQLTEAMAKLQKRMRHMGDAVFLVSFSVDPERDTPEKLREYAQKYHANPRRWRFVTGDLKKVEEAVVKGFKMPMDPNEPAPETPTLFDITHGTRFVLVDQAGRVRGFYETDEAGLDDLVADLAVIANLGPGEGKS